MSSTDGDRNAVERRPQRLDPAQLPGLAGSLARRSVRPGGGARRCPDQPGGRAHALRVFEHAGDDVVSKAFSYHERSARVGACCAPASADPADCPASTVALASSITRDTTTSPAWRGEDFLYDFKGGSLRSPPAASQIATLSPHRRQLVRLGDAPEPSFATPTWPSTIAAHGTTCARTRKPRRMTAAGPSVWAIYLLAARQLDDARHP
jgi:hypothetical protein